MEIKTDRLNKITHISQLLPEQLQVPVKFETVDLTDEEKDLAIQEAMVKKHAKLEDDRRKRLAIEKQKDLRREWNAVELYDYARGRATEIIRLETGNPSAIFEPMQWQQKALQALSLYFTKSVYFEELNPVEYNSNPELDFSLNKGLWLFSNPGQGKTLMMDMFSRNKRLCYRVVQCPKIVQGYVKYGEEHIQPYSNQFKESPQPFNYFQGSSGICYNDLGTEPEKAINYGNSINVMETIFLNTYENKVPYHHRHVTTNLTFDQVKQMYGVRFVDRIKQCFNIIEIKGESLRK
jgi:hypothetical protein